MNVSPFTHAQQPLVVLCFAAGSDSRRPTGAEHHSFCLRRNRLGEDIHHGGDPHRPWDHGAQHERHLCLHGEVRPLQIVWGLVLL